MNSILLDSSLIPEARWNTHIACLARLCDAASRGIDIAQVAGLTGLAFRTALAARVSPTGLFLSWAWEPSFRRWLAALGLDADVTAHKTTLQTFDSWLDRQHARIRATIERGFPVMYWDNVGFALILGINDDGYLVSGVPELTVHPEWIAQPQAAAFCSRLMTPSVSTSNKPALHQINQDDLRPVIYPAALFIYVHGVSRFDPEAAYQRSINSACAELLGQIEYPRIMNGKAESAPRFGTNAFTGWREELKDGRVHGFGMVQATQSLIEARRLAMKYLFLLIDNVEPKYRSRIEQAAQFMKRIVEHLQPAAMIFNMPYDPDEQVTQVHWDKCRESLYQVQMTEQTLGRLLGSIAQEYRSAGLTLE